MTALAIALAVVALGAAGAIVGLMAKLTAAQRALDAANLAGRAGVAAADLAADRANRAEEVVVNLKREIAKLEVDLDACADPGLVRERLRGLFPQPAPAGAEPNGVPR